MLRFDAGGHDAERFHARDGTLQCHPLRSLRLCVLMFHVLGPGGGTGNVYQGVREPRAQSIRSRSAKGTKHRMTRK